MGDKKTQSKWFVVATEGATTDGRTINRIWIEQMAKNYDPKTYGARINLEHYKTYIYWNDFAHSKAYGETLLLNPHLANQAVLEIGTAVILPEKQQQTIKKDTLKLWD